MKKHGFRQVCYMPVGSKKKMMTTKKKFDDAVKNSNFTNQLNLMGFVRNCKFLQLGIV